MSRRNESGNGDFCPVAPAHGRMMMLPSGRQYCPTQDHDNDKSPNTYEHDGATPFRRRSTKEQTR